MGGAAPVGLTFRPEHGRNLPRHENKPMDHDDAPRGRLLTRREAVALLGVSSAALLTGVLSARQPRVGPGSPSASCVVRPEQAEGPYFIDERLRRSDIRSDPADGSVKEGVSLALTFAVSRIAAGVCTPLPGAQVDVWHCDALGAYSDVDEPGSRTAGQKFLRGYQLTDSAGLARFRTIYPGWYPSRAVHIHFKIRTAAPQGGGAREFTSQLYFDDALTDRVHARPPYAAKGRRGLRNGDDLLYRYGGDQLQLAVSPAAEGYAATFAIGLQLSDT
jgi:protocatechuate 3,4-dioxygenase beta subunit